VGTFIAVKAVNRAGELRKAFEIAAFFKQRAVHAGREAHHLGIVFIAIARNQVFEPGDDALELSAAAVKAVDAGVDQEPVLEEPVKKGLAFDAHGDQLARCGSRRCTSSRFDMLPKMRSLLIMIGAERTSRMWRPMLNGVSFL
jgi:hypothetical protein